LNGLWTWLRRQDESAGQLACQLGRSQDYLNIFSGFSISAPFLHMDDAARKESFMRKFCLLCPGVEAAIPEHMIEQLRALPGVIVNHASTMSPIASVSFGGDEVELRELLAQTEWSEIEVVVSESRSYRLSERGASPLPAN